MTNNDNTEHKNYSARSYGRSGALQDLLTKIGNPEIRDLEDILQFKKNYTKVRQKKVNDSIAQVKLQLSRMMSEMSQLRFEREWVLKSKTEELNQKISRLESELRHPNRQSNFIANLYYKIKRWRCVSKVKYFRNNFHSILHGATKNHDKRIAGMEIKIKHVETNVENVAIENIAGELFRFDQLRSTIEEEKYLIYGAIGERDVISKLKELPATYYVINDFRKIFDRPIYNRAENDRIFSIQVDHLVVGPTGIFIIETKNWSNKSISNEMFFSPVKQVKRLGFALFVLLNSAVKTHKIMRTANSWGERKISPKQTIVFINSIPHVQFQFVKILGIERLNSYITYGKQEFTTEEIQDIVGYLLG